jgi:DoxX-like protein
MLNLSLWIVAGLLAVVLLVSSAKLFVPKEKMAGMSTFSRWVEDFSPSALKAIGALELLAAAGLILPRSTSRQFWCRWLLWVRCCCLLAR